MSETQKKRKSPVNALIKHEEWHFKYEAARLIRDLYLRKNRPAPKSVHDHYTTLDDLFKKHKPVARETTYIKLGKRWVKDLLESSAEFGQNTSLIKKLQAESTRRMYDRQKYYQAAQKLFLGSAEQKAYVHDKMKDWTFNDPYLSSVNHKEAEEICPTYHHQFAQHERNVRSTIFRAFEAIQYAISGVKKDIEYEKAHQIKDEQSPSYKLSKEDMPPTWGDRPDESRLADVLRNSCNDDFTDDVEESEKPTPIARQEKYVQGLFPFMQHTR